VWGWPDYIYRVGQNRICTSYMTVCIMYDDFSALGTVYTPYIHIYVWFWPTLYAYIWCDYGNLGREITKCTVIYGVYIYTVPANPRVQWRLLLVGEVRDAFSLFMWTCKFVVPYRASNDFVIFSEQPAAATQHKMHMLIERGTHTMV